MIFEKHENIWMVRASSTDKSAWIDKKLILDVYVKENYYGDGESANMLKVVSDDVVNDMNLIMWNYGDIKNTKELHYIFFTIEAAEKFVAAVKSGEIVAEKLTPEDDSYGVHMSHCFQGWNRCSCKYGEVDICPANPGSEALELRENNRIRKHLKPIFIEKYYGGIVPNFSETPDGTFYFIDYYINSDFFIFVEGYKCYTKFPIEDDDY